MSDATTNTNASQMLQAFIAAGQALDELPKVKAELASAQENISVGNQIIDHMTAEARAAQDHINQLQSALAQKEAELSDITFRHSQMQNKFRTVADALGLVTPEVKPAATDVSLPTQSDHVSGPGQSDSLGQSAMDPTSAATENDSASSGGLTQHAATDTPTAAANPSQDQRDMDPTSNTGDQSEASSHSSQPSTANDTHSSDTPTASAVAAPVPNPTPSTSPTESSGTINPAADTPIGSAGRSAIGDDDAAQWSSWSNPHHTDHPASA